MPTPAASAWYQNERVPPPTRTPHLLGTGGDRPLRVREGPMTFYLAPPSGELLDQGEGA